MTKSIPKVVIAPSILSADFSRLSEEIKNIRAAGADWVHVDVMDGHFVDNLTLGPPVIESIQKASALPLDVHLMIEKPENTIDRYIKAGATTLTIHVEACTDLGATLKRIRELGVRPGITLRPHTNLSQIEKFFELVDLVLIMTVNPGWGGQKFMEEQMPKVQKVRQWAEKNNPKLDVEVDGGINPETARVCRDAGANVLVAGHAVFRAQDYVKAIRDLRGSY